MSTAPIGGAGSARDTETRLARVFAGARARGRKVLIAYLCVGDPSLEESAALCLAAADAGADVLELGVPFSDPTADGPAIARASERALRAGATFDGVVAVAAAVRARSDVPMVLFGYYNPLLVTGENAAVERAAAAGIDALLVVDLPPDEGPVLRAAAARANMPVIPLLAPTSDEARVDAVLAGARGGFIYYVSVTGVTGSLAQERSQARGLPRSLAQERGLPRSLAPDGAGVSPLALASRRSAEIAQRCGLPVVVGFGIDGPDAARVAAGPRGSGADGVVVGTALVKAIESSQSAAARRAALVELVGALRRALDEDAPPG
ncbi:MAG: tryptophan synthase subunit alpha [Polyangiaceae bacterium]